MEKNIKGIFYFQFNYDYDFDNHVEVTSNFKQYAFIVNITPEHHDFAAI